MVTNLIKKFRQFPAHILLFETFLGALLSAGSLAIFVKLRGETLEQEMAFLDKAIWNFFYSVRSPLLTKIMLGFSFLGGQLAIIAVVVIAIFLLLEKHRREAFLLSFLFVMSGIIDTILKLFTQRPRPEIAPLQNLTDFSFPSGHAMNSFVFYASIAYLFYQTSRNKKQSTLLALFVSIIILIVGLSRIYLGVHYTTDVVAGYIAGFWWLVTIIVLEKTLILFKIFRQHQAR